ncbi:MAG: ElyC/SanA/YdcF family protein [Candidatus Vogelbacteria bacterium]
MRKVLRYVITILGILLVAIILTSLIIKLKTDQYIYQDFNQAPKAPIAMILGAAILKDGGLSPILRERADRAIELYQAGKVEKILVTGNNSLPDYNEVNPVRLYLLENNISDQNIFLNYTGFDTYSSMYRARDIFPAESMMVVSQSFHLPRALFIARALGLKAYGVEADRDRSHYLLRNYLREMLANVKAVLDVVSRRELKYL